MTPVEDYRTELLARLDGLREAGLLRSLRLPSGVDLVSNDYLGLTGHPHLIESMREALRSVPAGSGGSRLLRGHHAVFARLEERLAAWSGAETALVFGSGYAANTGLLPAVADEHDVVLSDERNHASLIDGVRLSGAQKRIYPHNDVGAVAELLAEPRRGRAFVVTESLFSMDGDLTPLVDLARATEAGGGLLIVDEAHATGLYGARGSGRVEELGLRERVLATIHTGGKALGSGGAWIAGSAVLRDLLISRARSLVFSTAPLPVLAAALEAGLDVVEREPERRAETHRKAALLRRALGEHGIAAGGASPILPVVVGTNEAAVRLQEGLAAVGFDARAVRPPTVPEGTARLRVTVRYPIPDPDLSRFAVEVRKLLRPEDA